MSVFYLSENIKTEKFWLIADVFVTNILAIFYQFSPLWLEPVSPKNHSVENTKNIPFEIPNKLLV